MKIQDQVKMFVLAKVTEYLVGGTLFKSVEKIVEELSQQELSGAEKRASALAKLKVLGAEISVFLSNLAIEVAVTILKYKK